MRFLLDENFPKAAASLLASMGHEAIDIRGTAHEGSGDAALFGIAQEARAAILTTDRDFFHTVPLLHSHHHGVVVFALRQPNRASILARLTWFLEHFGAGSLEDKVFQLRDETYRALLNREGTEGTSGPARR